MSGIRTLRIVNTSRWGDPRLTDVFDAETGDKLLNVYQVELLVNRDQVRVRVDVACEWEYEGPVEVRRLRLMADGTTEEIPDKTEGEAS